MSAIIIILFCLSMIFFLIYISTRVYYTKDKNGVETKYNKINCDHDFIVLEKIKLKDLDKKLRKTHDLEYDAYSIYSFVYHSYYHVYNKVMDKYWQKWQGYKNIFLMNKVCLKCNHEEYDIDIFIKQYHEVIELMIKEKYKKEMDIIDKQNKTKELKDLLNYKPRKIVIDNDNKELEKRYQNYIKAHKELDKYIEDNK